MLRLSTWGKRGSSIILAPILTYGTNHSIPRRLATSTVPSYSSQSLSTDIVLKPSKGTIAVAMSGGIDSSVAALLLKDQGYDCVGVFMTNWDTSDEVGDITCNINRDREHMKQVCERLEIPAIDVNFVKDYWTEVFVPFLDGYRSGMETPNPDVMCNRFIKFHRFKEYLLKNIGISTIATGHYVRTDESMRELDGEAATDVVSRSSSGCQKNPRLLMGVDDSKDQSYFLCMTKGAGLKDVLFPLGGLTKNEVKAIAAVRLKGLAVLSKKESMGVCFIGKRDLPQFLSNYMPLTPGRFIDVDSREIVGAHSGKEALTVGQKARLGGCTEKYFICSHFNSLELSLPAVVKSKDRINGEMEKGKKDKAIAYDRQRGDVLVALGVDNPKLYHTHLTVRADRMSWVAGQPPVGILNQLAALRKLSKRSRDGIGSNSSTSTGSSDIRSNDGDGFSVKEDFVTVGGDGNDTMVKGIEVKAFTCEFRARYQHKMGVCSITVRLLPASTTSTSFSKPHSALLHKDVVVSAFPSHQQDLLNGQDDDIEVSGEVEEVGEDYELDVVFHEARRAITPGQVLALYLGDDCLGGGIIS